MILVIIVFLSALLGSFYNVCIHRIGKGESIVFPSSHCPRCKHPLSPIDLVPLFSYIFLLGRCRYCKGYISIRYPVVEAITILSGILLYHKYGITWQFVSYFSFIGILIIISFIDIQHQIIPNQLVIICLILGVLLSLTNITIHYRDAILGLIVGSGSLLLISMTVLLIIGKEGMGGGDVKLLGVIGLFLGWKLTLLTLLLSIYLGGIFSILLLLLKIKRRGEYIPFGPFISLAGVISLLWGNDIIQWYVTSFL